LLAELERRERVDHEGSATNIDAIKMIDATSISSGEPSANPNLNSNGINALCNANGFARTVVDGRNEKNNKKPGFEEKSSATSHRRRSNIERGASILRRSLRSHPSSVISAKDMRTAFMLFVVSFLYVVFYLPSIISTYLALLWQNITPNLYLSYLFFSNSAINPLIYCFLNPNFRADLVKLFFKRGPIYDRCVKNTK
jgi:hypothetical protein